MRLAWLRHRRPGRASSPARSAMRRAPPSRHPGPPGVGPRSPEPALHRTYGRPGLLPYVGPTVAGARGYRRRVDEEPDPPEQPGRPDPRERLGSPGRQHRPDALKQPGRPEPPGRPERPGWSSTEEDPDRPAQPGRPGTEQGPVDPGTEDPGGSPGAEGDSGSPGLEDPGGSPGAEEGPARPSPEGRVVCARCGTVAAGDTAPPTWLCSVEEGHRLHFCEGCARLHIRAIESRLDSLWW